MSETDVVRPFGVQARQRGAIGVFGWYRVDAVSAEDAMRRAHDMEYEVNAATDKLRSVGVALNISKLPKLPAYTPVKRPQF